MAQEYNPSIILIDDVATGHALLQSLRRNTALPLVGINRRAKNRLERFARLAQSVEAGAVRIAAIDHLLANELIRIPDERFTSQVDALSQYLEWKDNAISSLFKVRRLF